MNNDCKWLSAQKSYPLDNSIRQLIIVKPTSGSNAIVLTCSKIGDVWHTGKLGGLKAIIGTHGVALSGQKREGDGKTPVGLFTLGTAFGYDQTKKFKMTYRNLTKDDKFIDDPLSPDYNTWVVGDTSAKSYESMLAEGEVYKLGMVINYNMYPVVQNMGSAIFMHVWVSGRHSTAGCVALKYKDLVKVMEWLDPAQNPHILVRLPSYTD